MNMILKVCKFGGSSLSNETQFKKVKDIVLSDDTRRIVVVSALGKRNSEDSKITDLLYILHAHLKYAVPYDDIWKMIETRFIDVEKNLKLNSNIEMDLAQLKSELNKNTPCDYLVSRGEYLTAKLMSSYLGYHFIDAKDIIIFNYDGTIDYETTEMKAKENIAKYERVLVPGFYGSYPNGAIKLLSRGGSDITGSILARSIHAKLYENWTDVSGILMADPRIIKNPKAIKEVTYTELRELSYMGASVLHEETIFPIQDMNIQINIKNTNDPSHPGTIITEKCYDNSQNITGIAGKTDFLAFEIYKAHMSNEVGFFRKTLAIFEQFNISVEHVPSGIDSISIIVNKSSVEQYLYEILLEIKKQLGVEAKINDDLALIAVVGRNMVNKSGISGKIFSVLGAKNISIKMIAQGPQELNIIIGIKNSDYKEAIKAIYDNLVL